MAAPVNFGNRAKPATAFRGGPTSRPERMRWSEPKTVAFRKRETAKRKGGQGGGS